MYLPIAVLVFDRALLFLFAPTYIVCKIVSDVKLTMIKGLKHKKGPSFVCVWEVILTSLSDFLSQFKTNRLVLTSMFPKMIAVNSEFNVS